MTRKNYTMKGRQPKFGFVLRQLQEDLVKNVGHLVGLLVGIIENVVAVDVQNVALGGN